MTLQLNSFTHRTNAGFSMVEVMVALMIFSIGLLGMASLQTTGLKQSHDTYLRTQALMLAHDMADRIRANLPGLVAGHYSNVDSASNDYAASACAGGGDCDAAELADLDLYEWLNKTSPSSVANVLPSGVGQINVGAQIVTVTLMWDEARSGATGTECSDNLSKDLSCFRLEFRP